MNTADEAAVPRLRRCLGKAAKAALRRGSRQRIVVRVVRIRIGSRAERDVIGTKEIREHGRRGHAEGAVARDVALEQWIRP